LRLARLILVDGDRQLRLFCPVLSRSERRSAPERRRVRLLRKGSSAPSAWPVERLIEVERGVVLKCRRTPTTPRNRNLAVATHRQARGPSWRLHQHGSAKRYFSLVGGFFWLLLLCGGGLAAAKRSRQDINGMAPSLPPSIPAVFDQ
jgi:hypothetical protein